MNNLLKFRERLNLTQEELAEKSGVSTRTIQRIEAGTNPKGHTLKAIIKALNISEVQLFNNTNECQQIDYNLIKIINLSSLLFFIPLGNILFPLLIIHLKKEVSTIAKQIVSVQIIWTISSFVLTMLTPFVKRWLSLSNQSILVVMILCILVNLYIIIRNTKEIDKHNKLFIKLDFNLI